MIRKTYKPPRPKQGRWNPFRKRLAELAVGECLEASHAALVAREAPPTSLLHSQASYAGVKITYRRRKDDAGRTDGYDVWRVA